MNDKILIAGHGGQGVVLAGSILANIAMEKGLETCGMVSYGAEMRGGASSSTVIISEEKIGSPVVINPATAIIMNQHSLEKFEESVEENGLIILNISECGKKVSRKDVKVIEINATKIAEELGDKKVANVVMVGAYLKHKKMLDSGLVPKIMKRVLPKADDSLIEINKKALQKGAELCS